MEGNEVRIVFFLQPVDQFKPGLTDVDVVAVVLEVRDIDCDCWLSNYGMLRAKGDGAGPVN